MTKDGFAKKFPEKSPEEINSEWAIKLIKRRNRKIARLMKWFDTIANTPQHFVSLSVDRTRRPYKSIKEENRIFDKFKRSLMRCYPTSWFIYKKEYDGYSHIHYHLIGTFYPALGERYGLARTKSLIRKLWDAANGFRWEGSTDVRTLKKAHYGYLVKPSKLNDDMHCVELSGASHMVGLIGKKNISFHEKYSVQLTDVEKNICLGALEEFFRQQGRSPKRYSRQLYSEGSFAFIPQDIMRKILEKTTGKQFKQLSVTND